MKELNAIGRDRSDLKLAKQLMDRPPPMVSAQSWVVLDKKSHKVLFGRLENERREVASLTKIMTCYTVLKLCDKLGVELSAQVKIDQGVEDVTGTTANLLPGDTLTIQELLYGLMLPSGNDAAYSLALFFGNIVL